MKHNQLTALVCLIAFPFFLFSQEQLEVEGAIKLGDTPNSEAGILKWDGSDFLGHDGANWLSLTEMSKWLENGNKIYYNAGNVGIGISNPLDALHVSQDIRLEDVSSILWYDGNDQKSYIYYNGLNLNIFNTTTGGNLKMKSDDDIIVHGYNGASRFEMLNSGDFDFRSSLTSNGAILNIKNETNEEMIRLIANESSTQGAEIRLRDEDGSITAELDGDFNNGGGTLLLENENSSLKAALYARESSTEGGFLRLWDDAGTITVELEANETSTQGGMLRLHDSDGTATIAMQADENTSSGARVDLYRDNGGTGISLQTNESSNDGATIKLYNDAGQLAIELDAEFNDGGDGRITTDVLQILGGSDLSENFDVRGEIAAVPGLLVSIDPDNPGALMVTRKAHDKKIAGVISGANGVRTGMLMSQESSLADGDFPVALTGRVYVMANVENGKIEPGDLLTSSNVPGEAMKAANNGRSNGAIIGKAMTILDKGSDYVLVLINLQ